MTRILQVDRLKYSDLLWMLARMRACCCYRASLGLVTLRTRRSSMRRQFLAIAAVLTWPVGQALGWGATGHEWATSIAIEKLPDDISTFVRDPAMLPELARMGRELNRSKGAGESMTGGTHYIEPSDDGDAIATFR
jgi:hypothetical protein